jgi:hypothetical protein
MGNIDVTSAALGVDDETSVVLSTRQWTASRTDTTKVVASEANTIAFIMRQGSKTDTYHISNEIYHVSFIVADDKGVRIESFCWQQHSFNPNAEMRRKGTKIPFDTEMSHMVHCSEAIRRWTACRESTGRHGMGVIHHKGAHMAPDGLRSVTRQTTAQEKKRAILKMLPYSRQNQEL